MFSLKPNFGTREILRFADSNLGAVA